MLDVDASGEIEFHEFYLLMALFIAIKVRRVFVFKHINKRETFSHVRHMFSGLPLQDGTEKQFVHRHARQIFEVIDYDGSGRGTRANVHCVVDVKQNTCNCNLSPCERVFNNSIRRSSLFWSLPFAYFSGAPIQSPRPLSPKSFCFLSGSISAEEFKAFGFLFNYRSKAAKKLFNEFDISGDQVSEELSQRAERTQTYRGTLIILEPKERRFVASAAGL